MSGIKGNRNALGNSGGKSLQDRKLAAEVRKLALKKIKAILETPGAKMDDSDRELYKSILIKLAGSILPRLNEHTGDGGDPFRIMISDEQADKIFKRRVRIMQPINN